VQIISNLAYPGRGTAPLVSNDELCVLSMYFAQRSAIGHGVSRAEIREMLLNLAEKKGFALAANVEFSCSSKYITKLVKRTHTVPGAVALQGSVPKGLSIPRAKAREPAVLDSFVTMLNGVFDTIKTKDGWETDAPPPELCFNVDEVG
jgi:hypothetical protein